MKRIVSLLLTFAMLIGMLPITAWSTESDAVSGTCGENLEWKLNANGTLIISGTGEMVDYSYESPAPWIRSNTNIAVTAIVFEGSVTKIGASAFSGLDEMESITIPETVTEIGDNAFSGCCKLTAITIPEAVTYIGEYAFFNCTAVEEIYYCAEAAEEIGTRAFALVGTDCKDTVVTIANTVKEIPASLFYADTTEDGCYPHITDVNFEDNSICESIGELAFWQCVDLTEVDIPKSVKTIGWGAFYGCSSLDKVNYAGTEDLWNDIDIGSDNDILTDHEIHYGESTDPSLAPHEHSYGDWYETKAPTQDAEGEERRDCTGCDHYEIRATDKLPVTEDSGNTCGENLTWTLVDGVLTISGTGFMDEYSENYPAPWYELRNEITSVVINNGVENISESAFAECSSIVSIDIADSVNSIGPYAFKDCSTLTSIDIPDAEQYIGMGTFMGCTSLESVSLPDNLLGIGYEAFRECKNLKSISIPDSVTEIEDGAFYLCTNLETIDLPSSELTMEGSVFNGCASLKAISIPEGTTTIGNAMFADCVNLESVELPSSVTVIHIAAFSGCTSLKSIVLPDKVTTIKNAAFNECSNLNSVTIPASVNSIETAAFGSCDALVDVYYAGTEDQWKEITIDELNDGLANATIHYQSAGGSSPEHHKHSYTAVTTAPTCTEQGYTTYTCSCNDSYVSDYVDAAGHSYGKWYEAKAPTQEEEGEERRECTGCEHFETRVIDKLSSSDDTHEHSYTAAVTEPTCMVQGYTTYTCECGDSYVDDYTEAAGHSFGEWYEIKTPSAVEAGEKRRDCNQCEHFETQEAYIGGTCGNNVTWQFYDGVLTISGIGKMDDYSYREPSPWNAFIANITTITIENGVTSIGNYAFDGCRNLSSITISESVTSIGGYTFRYCNGLTSITIPEGITSIEEYTFHGCSSLTSITIPEGVTSIGYRTFEGCTSLSGITIPESITSIEEYTFRGCSSLTSITIPEGVTSIGDYGFASCSSLSSITIPESVTSIGEGTFSSCSGLTSITIPEGVTSIGDHAFDGCSSLSSITIPESVTSIGGYTFRGCSGLTSITIPEGVTSIGAFGFASCSSLSSITIPESVTSIGSYAFDGCSSLSSIVIPEGVIGIGNYAFNGCSSLSSIIIPEGVTSIGFRTFDGCSSLTSIVIPEDVTIISYGAFCDCFSLSDVYYAGSKEQWNAIEIGDLNSELSKATIHYNSTGSNDAGGDSAVNGTVRYFYEWNETEKTAFFDTDPDTDYWNYGSKVTDETDKSFLENLNDLVGTYVLVETKVNEEDIIGPTILLSIKPVETKVGVVTSADENTIVIDGESYTTPADLMFPEIYIDQFVTYYLYENQIVQINIMGTTEGTLSKWDSTTGEITIRTLGNSGTEIMYIFDGYTDQTSVDFLNAWDLYCKVYEGATATVKFKADPKYIYRINGEMSRKIDFHEKIYRADYLLSDVPHNLDFYLRVLNQYSPSRMVLGVNKVSSMNELWSSITVTLDTLAEGGAYAKFKFKQADMYETILLNALEVSIEIDSSVSLANKTIKETTETTKTIVKNVKRVLEFKDDLDIAVYPSLNTMTLEQKMRLKKVLTDVLKEGKYTGLIMSMSDASDILDSIMGVATTVEDFVTKVLVYEKLWEISNSMAAVLDEMYAKTPQDFEHTAMRSALSFCSNMIKETSKEEFENQAILRSDVFASEKFIEEGISYVWGKVMKMAKAANPNLSVLLFGYKAGRTIANVLFNVDNISEEIFKLNAISQYSAVLDSATMTLINQYRKNKTISNAESLLSALSLQFSLSYEDCNVAYSYADAVDDALYYKIKEYIKKETGKAEDLKKFSTNRKKEFFAYSIETDTFWIDDLKEDYPELYPIYADRINTEPDNVDDVLVVPITSSYAIQCPVNVFVYNNNGSLLVDMSKEKEYISDYLLAFVVGEHKYIDFYADQEYQIVCVGYDVGTMSIDISEYRGSEKIRNAYFNNLVVTDRIVYETVTKTNPTDKVIHTITCGNDVINADFDSNVQVGVDEHTHSGGSATCTKKAVCTVCGTSYGELAAHEYDSSWSQGDAKGHWHECKNCSAHDAQVKHTPGAAATEDTAQFCTVCGYVITPALGHTCTAGTKWYSNGTYHWHLCTSCGAWVKTSYHSYSSDTDETCNVCGYVQTVKATEPTEETEVATTETTEATDPDEEVIATETAPTIVSTEANEILPDNAVSEHTDSHGISSVLITVFAIVALGSLAALAIMLVYKKRHESE